MTFPALLFLLYAVLLVLALAGGSWVAHLRPAPTEAQRVTDAVERAGLSQLGGTTFNVILCLGLLVTQGALTATLHELPTLAFAVAPVVGAAIALLVAFSASRRLVRVAGQMVGARTTDTVTSLSGKAALSASLTTVASAGILVTGLEVLCKRWMDPQASLQVALLSVSSGSLLLVVLGRALAVAWATAEEGSQPATTDTLSATTLARLVGASFGAAVLRSAGLFTLAGLTQVALAFLSLRSDAATAEVGRFTQLLLPLGLLATCFGAMAIRSSEREPAHWAWLRGGAVTLVILLAGLWSLAGLIALEELKRRLPAALSFLIVGAAVATWLSGLLQQRMEATEDDGPRSASPILILLLPVALALALHPSLSDGGLPIQTIPGAVLGAAMALVPLAVLWQMAADALLASGLCQVLATEGQWTTSNTLQGESLPDRGYLLATSAAVGPAAICSFDMLFISAPSSAHTDVNSGLWLLGVGALLGSIAVLQSTSANRALSKRGAQQLSHLTLPTTSTPGRSTPSLGAVLDAARAASAQRQWVWTTSLLAPPLLLGLLRYSGTEVRAASLAPGYLLGVMLCSALVKMKLDHLSAGPQRPHGSLALPAALAILAWSLSLLMSFSG